MRSNDPSAGLDVGSDPHSTLEHTANVEFCEVAISHAFQEMRTKLKLPIPPFGPSLHFVWGMFTGPVRYCLTNSVELQTPK